VKRYEPVRYELLRPSEVRKLREECPVAYIPVGSLEWHGVQNPLGTDGLKAHAMCCEAALKYGGVVLPTLFLGILGDGRGWGPEGWEGFTVTVHDQASMEATIHRVAAGLVADEWKVLVGVTGHDVAEQRDAIHDGIQRACKGTEAKGFGVMECENWSGNDSFRYTGDHAGVWETSTMMYAHDHRVSLDELKEQMAPLGRTELETMQMNEPEGIGGYNPLKFASAEIGRQIVEFCADRLGTKATDILEGRLVPPDKADGMFLEDIGPTG